MTNIETPSWLVERRTPTDAEVVEHERQCEQVLAELDRESDDTAMHRFVRTVARGLRSDSDFLRHRADQDAGSISSNHT